MLERRAFARHKLARPPISNNRAFCMGCCRGFASPKPRKTTRFAHVNMPTYTFLHVFVPNTYVFTRFPTANIEKTNQFAWEVQIACKNTQSAHKNTYELPVVDPGEVDKVHTKSLWCVGEVHKIQTKSLWLVREKCTQWILNPCCGCGRSAQNTY